MVLNRTKLPWMRDDRIILSLTTGAHSADLVVEAYGDRSWSRKHAHKTRCTDEPPAQHFSKDPWELFLGFENTYNLKVRDPVNFVPISQERRDAIVQPELKLYDLLDRPDAHHNFKPGSIPDSLYQIHTIGKHAFDIQRSKNLLRQFLDLAGFSCFRYRYNYESVTISMGIELAQYVDTTIIGDDVPPHNARLNHRFFIIDAVPTDTLTKDMEARIAGKALITSLFKYMAGVSRTSEIEVFIFVGRGTRTRFYRIVFEPEYLSDISKGLEPLKGSALWHDTDELELMKKEDRVKLVDKFEHIRKAMHSEERWNMIHEAMTAQIFASRKKTKTKSIRNNNTTSSLNSDRLKKSMAGLNGLIDFNTLEAQKENIEPIRQGRSAQALAKAFAISPVVANEANEAKQAAFEEELKSSHELDDPLEVWIRYLAWTNEAFPTGQNAQSGYIELLERCSKQFVRSAHYANDPRYLKLWIEYARFSDDPRELFCFLARNEIGQQLATFYEEYAAWLETMGRKGQADEVYQMGLMAGARPVSRLRRKFDEFSARLAANPPRGDDPSSPPIAPVRAALSTKLGGVTEAQGAAFVKSGKPKLMIFTDEEVASAPVGSGGWGSIGTLRDRKKENTVEVRSMQGEKLQQRGGLAPAQEKLAIFVDPAVLPKKAERVACDLEAVYAVEGQEMSFEELKAQGMGLLNHVWPSEELVVESAHEDVYVSVMDADSPIKDGARSGKMKQLASPTINTKAAMDDILDLFSKPLKCEQSDASSDSEEDEDDFEPTNTFQGHAEGWTLQATELVADTQYESDNSSDEESEPDLPVVSESDEDEAEELSSDDLVAALPALQVRQEEKHGDEPENALPAVPATPQPEAKRINGMNLMTPITEDTEHLLLSVVKPRPLAIAEEESDEATEHIDSLYSSPFIENPEPRPAITKEAPPKRPALAEKLKARAAPVQAEQPEHEIPRGPVKGPLVQEMLCNPMDASVRNQIFRCMFPQLGSFAGCKLNVQEAYGKKFDAIEKYIRALNKRGAGEATQHLEVILDFDSRYAIKRKLGEGAFAPVFLVENISGVATGSLRRKLEACKIERPGSAWEFYIMRQAERRLGVSRASQSVARAHEYYQFQDTSFLLIDFKDQGTILDLVNSARSEAGGVDEVLAMFLAVELLRVVEQLHAKGLLHGDLKADNCLLRFDSVAEQAWSAAYKRDGSDGWESKGISLIDFGRGIDMKVFKEGVQFMADWKTDEQDCVEMREARPWTYQVDYHGLAGILHSLLFGKYIETSVEATGLGKKRYTLKNTFKRYWKQALWEPCFNMLLNPQRHATLGELPINDKLREVREQMEDWLEANAEKGIGLKAMIRKLEADLLVSRKR
ncbi:hypothetical protein BCR37DRAFT_412764 [Protomyces lactucae-debilis]|uniref:Mad3/BUB1 homology region 1-domain-containing protein n=1 Tax=Protomyces lactucae-debilis TaxID=2754530 RepID=A0A1Y2FM59_PROLT|nr:uncharacterized protein BCR37DRAFT_412764 [Protomyces lactucae-debilis]ORY84306.1 hypothetical protein BCR37DRAFT_412764 [Protomyces lactucae-debilis]